MKYAWAKLPKRLNKKTMEWTLDGRLLKWVPQKRGRGRIVEAGA